MSAFIIVPQVVHMQAQSNTLNNCTRAPKPKWHQAVSIESLCSLYKPFSHH